MTVTAMNFELPAALEASAPIEHDGRRRRDDVRLLVADERTGGLIHARFHELPELLVPGDLVVVNVSATLPAALDGRRADGFAVAVHASTPAPRLDDRWRVVELRSKDGAVPAAGAAGERIELPAGTAAELVAPYGTGERLWLGRLDEGAAWPQLLAAHGRPIRYGHVDHPWPLQDYQNVYATTPGSSEMPSAGRPFTSELITALVTRGIAVAPLTLHCGVSSPERHEPPFAEPFSVPQTTAEQIAATRSAGGRVIAVGTTVVRALESAADEDGVVHEAAGWTDLVIDADVGVHAVDGMITGWHEPEASHLLMLEALISADLLERSYRSALDYGYRWHEFGDSHLLLR